MTSSVQRPSVPGFGYIIIPHPYDATFNFLGQYHIVSYFPESHVPDPIEEGKICLWLGPDPGVLEVLVYLIWPGKGMLNFGQALSAGQSSRVVDLIQGTGPFSMETPTAIARDLLQINRKPCILFIQWSSDPGHIIKEADELCLHGRVLQAVKNLALFLESRGVPGDAVESKCLSEWYKAKFEEIKLLSPQQYLFDPSVLIVGVIQDLVTTMAENNKMEVASKNVLVPLSFVRSWAGAFGNRVTTDGSLLMKIARKESF